MSKNNITNNIRKLRFENDEMTQQELAEKAGATRQTILALEKGKYAPSLELAFRIALSLNTTLDNVFQYQSPDEKETSSSK